MRINRFGLSLVELLTFIIGAIVLVGVFISIHEKENRQEMIEAGLKATEAIPTAESSFYSVSVERGGTRFILEKGDSSVLIENSFLATPNNSIRKVTMTEYGERTEWIIYEKRFRDTNYRRGVNAYYVYTSHGMPVGYVQP